MVRSERTTERFYEGCGRVHAPVSMLFPPIDPNERFRERRATVRRRKRLRRSAAVGAVLLAVLLLGMGAQFVGTGNGSEAPVDLATLATAPTSGPQTLPIELRGVHVTMGLASLPGKLDEYLDLEREGLTALELDVKDENGDIGFTPRSVPLAVSVGAARDYYDARDVVQKAHQRGIYLIGRIVVFEDPVLARARPDLAIRRTDGSVWHDAAGLGWTNPYERRVWRYNVDVAVAAAKAGFDEIMFDYVRFPSDGDVDSAVFRNRHSLAKREAIPAFLRYARSRLEPHDVRMSAAVFGLSAARDLGIGQLPRQMAPYLDTVYAMTYPSLFGAGELGLQDPSRAPGATVSRALRRFELALRGRDVLARAVGPGLQLLDPVRARAGTCTDRCGTALRREGLHAVERRGPVYRRCSGAALVARAPGVLDASRRLRGRSASGREAGRRDASRTRPTRGRRGNRPRRAGSGTSPPRKRSSASTTRPSSSARSASGCDWGEAQAAIWLPRGRDSQ